MGLTDKKLVTREKTTKQAREVRNEKRQVKKHQGKISMEDRVKG